MSDPGLLPPEVAPPAVVPPAVGPDGQVAPGQEVHQSLRERYSAQAYANLGLDSETFHNMDPLVRNRLITGAYADMYQSDPDTMKWAGMAAYASNTVGTGMQQSHMLDAMGNSPLGALGGAVVGAPDGEGVRQLLADGNAGVFDDLMWQHLAFQQGGIEELERAAEAGEIPPEQLEGWRGVAAGQTALAEARASGDPDAIEAAQNQIWGGNGALLQYEQEVFLQDTVYDSSPEAREAFSFMSGGLNVLGLPSPIPGGEEFGDFRDRTGATGDADVGDRGQRWDWIRDSMLPSYRALETGNNGDMMADMQRFSAGDSAGSSTGWGAATGAIDVLGWGATGAAAGTAIVPAMGTLIGGGIGMGIGGAQAIFGEESDPNSGLEVPLVDTHITGQEGVGIAGMAAGGAAIGSVVPAVGTLLGAGIGAGIGLIGSIWD